MTFGAGQLAQKRAADLRSFSREPFDVLVIGGGIVGAGLARDAALRGLQVGLVEQNDFASGTSSRSSRLLHGGLRYLAQGRLKMVREASIEKRVLHRIAPHLAEPLPIFFPAYRGSKWPRWQMVLGVKVYDLLCGGKNLGKSESLSREDFFRYAPSLAQEGLTGGVKYYDAFTNDARLVIDTLRSAQKNGGSVINYLRFVDATRQDEHWICELEDREGGEKLAIQCRAIVNASGPWAEKVPHSRVKLRLTKGIHLVMDRSRLPVSGALAITENKRLLFILPWGERLIVGTTDTDYSGSIDSVHASGEEIKYLIDTVNNYFPAAGLTTRDIESVWAGLRPLIAEPNGAPSDIDRSHQLRNPEPGWWDLAGGKLTTYRLMAEQALDQIVRSLGCQNNQTSRCRTGEVPLLNRVEVEGVSGIIPPEFSRRIVEHCCCEEWAIHMDDLMTRRTGWRHYLKDHSMKAEQAADWMSEMLGWGRQKRDAELESYREHSNEKFG